MNCEIEVPYGSVNDMQSGPCGSYDAVRECSDCGKKLCRKHTEYCCDRYLCEFCLETHQLSEDHIPAEEVLAS